MDVDEPPDDDEPSEGESSDPDEALAATGKRKAGVLASSTLAVICKKSRTISSWKLEYPWLTWDGDINKGMSCTECKAAGKSDVQFTDEGGCVVFMKENCAQHHKNHHATKPKAKVSVPDATAAAARSSLGAAAAEAGASASDTMHAQRLAYTLDHVSTRECHTCICLSTL